MPELFAYTDGACSGNPGPGGWGVVLVARDGDARLKTRELSGGEAQTTNNRMELMAAIAALEALERPATLTVVTDSAYVRDGVTRWIHGWKQNGWRTADRKPVKNEDLWRRLDTAAARHQVAWDWVKGHAGHPENERADAARPRRHGPLQAAARPARPARSGSPPSPNAVASTSGAAVPNPASARAEGSGTPAGSRVSGRPGGGRPLPGLGARAERLSRRASF